jgi:hypothetical protein
VVSDFVIAHGQLLSDLQFEMYDRLAIQRPENDSLLVVARIHANPHLLAFARRITSKLNFYVVATSIGG